MSIFGKIASAIFGIHAAHADEIKPDSAPMASNMPASSTSGTNPAAGTAGQKPASAPGSVAASTAPVVLTGVDVATVLDRLEDNQEEDNDLDWRKSIVDLMKLLKLDSSLTSRKELAKELGYTGDMSDSASMNVWLHKQVMTKLAQNGGIVPSELKH